MKKKTSVIIIDEGGKDNRVLQVPTRILLNWKKYMLFFSGVIAVLLVVLGVFIYQKTSAFYQEKLAKANRIRSLIDIKKMKKAFRYIDKGVYDINSFLEERGLEKLKIKNTGGVSQDFDITDVNEFADYYKTKIEKIKLKLENTPLGAPVSGQITSGFGFRTNPFGYFNTEHHSGIDFKGNIGDPVRVSAGGKVVLAGVNGGYGNCVIVEHGGKLKSLYAHLSKILVKVGEEVSSGQLIGELGNTGRSTGSHLHYEIMSDGKKTDPKPFIN
ncbi:MAG: M23 family metallopeptidase [Bergeyella sp.]|nr:M23 family metallopeptidase [Bergeyella sp.]